MLKSRIIRKVEPYPELLLRLRSVYKRVPITNGIRLLCYARGKCVLEDSEFLSALSGQVEIETLYTCLNMGTERAMFFRYNNTPVDFPYYAGVSGAGRVKRVGRKVRGIKKGALVAGNFCHSSINILDASKVVVCPEDFDPVAASMIHLCIIAMQGIRMGRVKKDSRVVILGQGIIGRISANIAKALGAKDVTCVVKTPAKLSTTSNFPAIAIEDKGVEEVVKLEADVVIDATGDPDAINLAIHVVNENGRVVLLGSNRGKTTNFDINELIKKSITLVGSHLRNQAIMPKELGGSYQDEAKNIIDLIQVGDLRYKDLVATTISPFQLESYYKEKMANDKVSVGVLVDWSYKKELKKYFNKPSIQISDIVWDRAKKIKVGLVGCGDIGIIDGMAISVSPGADLVSVMDIDRDLASNAGRKLSVPAYTSYESLLESDKIDTVFLAVPHYLHSPLAMKAIKKGKNVIVEKPLCTSYGDAKLLLNEAIKNNVLLRTFYPWQFEPTIRLAKKLIAHDLLGKVLGGNLYTFTNRRRDYWEAGRSGRAPSTWRLDKDKAGGGFLIMNMVHDIDILMRIFEIDIKSVYAVYDTLYHPGEVEDTIVLHLKGNRGEILSLIGGNAVKGYDGYCQRIWGENGTMVLEDNILSFYSLRPIGQYKANRWYRFKAGAGRPGGQQSRINFLTTFSNDVAKRSKNSELDSGLLQQKIIHACYLSGEKDIPIILNSLN